jgi:FkbM family methyltransferase
LNFAKKIYCFYLFKIWVKLRINHWPSYYTSHSQFGEDMILRSIFKDKSKGFYVDIGAHHPIYYSNTYHFYLKGWRGLNIDATPGSMSLFKFLRKNDINIETCIGPKNNEDVLFYTFDKSSLNTFDPQMAEKAKINGKLLKTIQYKTKTLEKCLEEYVPIHQKIDFLSIDVEGLDETILRSNNWERFSPEVIIFESHTLSLENFKEEVFAKYLNEVGYSIIGKTGPSFIAQLRK